MTFIIILFLLCCVYLVIVNCAEYLFCILCRFTAHCSVAEMPLEFMQCDQPTWTFINKFSIKKTKKKMDDLSILNIHCKTCKKGIKVNPSLACGD